MPTAYNLLVILGPTASGKTRLAVQLAHALVGEIISADSRQVYRGLDIGSGKDLAEYGTGGDAIPYHLIDAVDLEQEFSVFEYQRMFYAAFEDVHGRNRLPVLAGGTGLYIDAVLKGYRMIEAPENPAWRAEWRDLSVDVLAARLRELKPRQHNTTDVQDRDRVIRALEIARYEHELDCAPEPAPAVRPLILGTRWPREELRARIRQRLVDRLEAGLVEEVENLLQSGVPESKLVFLGLEYRYCLDFLRGDIKNRNDLIQKLTTAISQFAKRQETWFRRMERQGWTIHWIDRADFDEARSIVKDAHFARGKDTLALDMS